MKEGSEEERIKPEAEIELIEAEFSLGRDASSSSMSTSERDCHLQFSSNRFP